MASSLSDEPETVDTERLTGRKIQCACCGRIFEGINLYDMHLKHPSDGIDTTGAIELEGEDEPAN